MNYARLATAAVAATIVDGLYGFLVYGNVMSREFSRYPSIYRPSDVQTGYLPAMFAGLLVAMLCAAAIYAKGYEGGSGLPEGARFGVLMGLVMAGYVAGVDYATMNLGKRIALEYAAAGLGEWIVVGAVIGLVYKPPAARASGRGAGV
jgi:hypothetical protein